MKLCLLFISCKIKDVKFFNFQNLHSWSERVNSPRKLKFQCKRALVLAERKPRSFVISLIHK